MSTTSLQLAKQNFKFSSAHFLIFDEKHAERLHGHNYQVRVEIGIPDQASLQQSGFFVDFNVFKKYIKSALDRWDEMVILPEQHQDMKFQTKGNTLEVTFRDRFYAFPVKEVVLLPVTNTSVEQLSRLLAEDFMKEFKSHKVSFVSVYVEETAGQGATTKVTA
ncbi:6-pyruvoyl trahydropterin synthase family protein [Bdellovibrio sp. HCB337]|uniref:6-pyruvoyl trahydropterin synthase family protein n=1 Tax=Bdellovibrio sp. HCB337 TaxID=3394358 RepID=UPI0039A5100E